MFINIYFLIKHTYFNKKPVYKKLELLKAKNKKTGFCGYRVKTAKLPFACCTNLTILQLGICLNKIKRSLLLLFSSSIFYGENNNFHMWLCKNTYFSLPVVHANVLTHI